jgi:hypothetical protein
MLLLAAMLFVPGTAVFGLHVTEMPKNIQTKVQEPLERAISLKLPLLQPAFHWTFMSREDFLSGKLLLRIVRNGQANEIVILENGQFSEGWEAMPLPPAPERGQIYFGFLSTRQYPTAPGDELQLELTVTKDLPGIGAIQTGILPAGKYTSTGSYSGLIDEYDTTFLAGQVASEGRIPSAEQELLLAKMRAMYEHKAFLEFWKEQWPLKITGDTGWLPEEQAASVKAMLEKLDRQEEPAPAAADSAVTDEKPSDKRLWLSIAIASAVVLVAVFVWRILVRR